MKPEEKDKLKDELGVKVPESVIFPCSLKDAGMKALGKRKKSAQNSLSRTWKENLRVALEVAGYKEVFDDCFVIPEGKIKEKVSEIGFVLLRHLSYYCDSYIVASVEPEFDSEGNPVVMSNTPIKLEEYATEMLRPILNVVLGGKKTENKTYSVSTLDVEVLPEEQLHTGPSDSSIVPLDSTQESEYGLMTQHLQNRWSISDANWKNAKSIAESALETLYEVGNNLNQEVDRQRTLTNQKYHELSKTKQGLLEMLRKVELSEGSAEIESLINSLKSQKEAHQVKQLHEYLQQKQVSQSEEEESEDEQ